MPLLSLMRYVTSHPKDTMTTFTAAPTHHNGYDFVAVLVKDMGSHEPQARLSRSP